ncbi:MAG: hypothetical protein RLZZ426_268 [Actinomycetota bacterium]|jgi:glycosyltransferase involved in cell wall biosynthesis
MPISIGLLSTYPPTACGIATFSHSLAQELIRAGARVGVVSMTDSVVENPPREVAHQWVRGDGNSAVAAIEELNSHDLVMLEHEFGIFSGQDGEDVLKVLSAVHVPLVTIMHTVVTHPTFNQRLIIECLLARSSRIVVMTQVARQRLIDIYFGKREAIAVIPHGAPDPSRYDLPNISARTNPYPVILTWGLIGRGKGIEWAIEAMSHLRDLDPMPHYYIVGQTHPKVVEREGESYRNELRELVSRWNLEECIKFDSRYLDTEDLFEIAHLADIVLLPYDSVEQVTSGVLAEAVTAGKPVISTGFPHAVELLSSGAGIIVERQSPDAIASAIRQLVTDANLLAQLTAEAKRIGPDQLWSAVADKYLDLVFDVSHERQLRGVSA